MDLLTGTNDGLAAFYGNGDGTLSSLAGYPLRGYRPSLVLADFDGDGYQDLAAPSSGDESLTVRRGRADGSLARPQRFPLISPQKWRSQISTKMVGRTSSAEPSTSTPR